MSQQAYSTIDLSTLETIPEPPPTSRWAPLPHHLIIKTFNELAPSHGFEVINHDLQLSKDTLRMLAKLHLRAGNGHDHERLLQVGLLNFNNHKRAFRGTAGYHVIICSNGMHTGDLILSQRHSRSVSEWLHAQVNSAFEQLRQRYHTQNAEIEKFKVTSCGDRDFNHLLIRAFEEQAITVRNLPIVLKNWKHPNYDAFRPRNLWSALNSFTEAERSTALPALAERTTKLNTLFNEEAALRN